MTADTERVRGLFIAVEGLDGAGTTSQCRLLADWLADAGQQVELTHEPSSGPLGEVLRSAIERRVSMEPPTMALAFAADRQDHLFNPVNGVDRALGNGTWVICDRYVLSSLAYQAAQGEDVDWLVALNSKVLVPDITVFVDTPPETCVERIIRRSSKPEYFHQHRMLADVQRGYREVLRRGVFIGGLVTADGSAPIDTVQGQVREGVIGWIESKAPRIAPKLNLDVGAV